MNDIFDTTNLDDIQSETLKKYIRRTSKDSAQMFRLVTLFKMKNPLNFDQILLGLYRKFGIEKKSDSLYAFMAGHKSHFKKVEGETGTYEFIGDQNDQ